VPGTKSYNAQLDNVKQDWWIVDGENETVGRIAADIATVLMGKHKPTYTPNEDVGDFVIFTNCEKVVHSGNKRDKRRFTWYTGYTGQRSETIGNRLERKPEQIIREAVRRMLPKNKIGRKMLSKLKIYTGADHPHGAQEPKPFEQWRRSSKA
jgi:large subunit ribosomal protein L13